MHGRHPRGGPIGVLAALLTLALACSAHAATFTVSSETDGHDLKPGDGACATAGAGPPPCTLRAAVEESNANDVADVINVPKGNFVLTLASGGPLQITSDIDVVGLSAESTFVSIQQEGALGADRVFQISTTGIARLARLDISGGRAFDKNGTAGGNIQNSGSLLVEDSQVRAGTADDGAGIANAGALSILRSTLTANKALTETGLGGAVYNLGNARTGNATVDVRNSTISGNEARLGAGLFSVGNSDDRLTFASSTVAFNKGGNLGGGGGVHLEAGTADFENTIIARNSTEASPQANCSAAPGAVFTSSGFNLDDTGDCGLDDPTDIKGFDPLLGALGDNGGATLTHALNGASPAINTGVKNCPATDQRGVRRPQGPGCDTGAYEFQDSTPPNTQIDSGPSGPTNSASANFSFTSTEGGSTFECSLDNADFTECSSPVGFGGLAQGAHTFQVRAIDVFGNVDASPAVRNWTVDTVVPDTTITDGPTGPTNSTSASFPFTSTEAGSTFQCSLDGAAFAACTSPRAYSALAQGAHSFQVRARDAAGNVDASPASRSWTVDTVAPDTTITDGPTGPTNDPSPSFTFSSNEAGSTIECKLDGPGAATGTFNACTSPKAFTNLAPGSYTLSVRATDTAGNVDGSPATRSFTIDTTAPETEIDSGPSGTTNSTLASFEFSSNEAGSTFECKLDDGDFGACDSPQNYDSLGEGVHTFTVRATDPAGNQDPSPAGRAWTIEAPDTTPPPADISSAPPASTSDHAATFAFGSPESGLTFECRLDGGAFEPCTSPKSYEGLAEGPHTFDLRATDAAGNATVLSRAWTVVPAQAKRKTLADLPPPVLGKQTNVEPVSGTVLVALPIGTASAASVHAAQKGLTFVPLQEARQIPVGSFLDTRKGIVRLQSATGAANKSYLGNFTSGLFQVLQSRKRSAKGLTDLVLKGGRFNSCAARKSGKGAQAALSKRALRRLRGNAKGRFRTRGRYSAATVRGTKWTVTDRCDGTLTKVTRGKVAVRDFRRKKTVLVKTGKSYLARAPR